MSARKEPNDEPGPDAEIGSGSGAEAGAETASGGRAFSFKLGATVTVSVVISLAIGFTAGRMSAPSTPSAAANSVPIVASSSAAASAGAPTESTSASGTASASVPASGTASVATTPMPGASGIGTVNLTDLTPASTTFNDPDKSPLLNGKAQLLAISTYVGGNTIGACGYLTGDAAYNLGRNYTKFTALIGVDDTSADEKLDPAVEIDGDGLKLADYTPTLGHPAQVSVNVTNVLRLDIKYTDAGAACSVNYLVVGNGLLSTVPGYTPPAPSPTS